MYNQVVDIFFHMPIFYMFNDSVISITCYIAKITFVTHIYCIMIN